MLELNGADIKERFLLRKVEKAVFARLGQPDFFSTDVSIVDEADIRQVNKNTRGVDSVTDVLSFPCFEKLRLPVEKSGFSDADFEGRHVLLGSVMICRERALSQAEEYGHTYRRELGFLLCHGLLHLLGFDHIKPEDEEEMTALQREIMDGVGLYRA
jgi:probable rRNA maturation factor